MYFGGLRLRLYDERAAQNRGTSSTRATTVEFGALFFSLGGWVFELLFRSGRGLR